MKNVNIEKLEFEKIKETIANFAINNITKEKIRKIMPEMDINIIKKELSEVSEARNIMAKSSYIPMCDVTGIDKVFSDISKNIMPETAELELVSRFLFGVNDFLHF